MNNRDLVNQKEKKIDWGGVAFIAVSFLAASAVVILFWVARLWYPAYP